LANSKRYGYNGLINGVMFETKHETCSKKHHYVLNKIRTQERSENNIQIEMGFVPILEEHLLGM